MLYLVGIRRLSERSSKLTSLFLGEPMKPLVKTAIPGPNSLKYIVDLSSKQTATSIIFVTDLEKSIGNYLADVDENLLLDLHCQIASMPIGYNNPVLLKAANDPKWIKALVNRPALGVFPSKEWIYDLNATFNRVIKIGFLS